MPEGGHDSPSGAPEPSKPNPFERYFADRDLDETNSWDQEIKRPEYKDIHRKAKDLFKQVDDRRTELRNDPLAEMTYGAAYQLLVAAVYLLEEPLEIAALAGDPVKEPQSEAAAVREQLPRTAFLLKLTGVLRELNLPHEELTTSFKDKGLVDKALK